MRISDWSSDVCSSDLLHRLGHANETGDVGAEGVISGRAIFLGGFGTAIVDPAHDRREPRFGLLERLAIASGVLLPFQRRGGNAARVRRTGPPEQASGIVEQAN